MSLVEKTMSTFINSVCAKGWKIKGETPSDGNCCFHAVSDQLQTLQPPQVIDHVNLRKKVVQYMEELSQSKKTELGQFLTQPFVTYLRDMAKDGTYAEHVCLQSLCSMLQTDIVIIHANEQIVKLSAPEPAGYGSIALGYIPELQHYVSLEKTDIYEVEDFVAVRLANRRTKRMFIAKVMEGDDDYLKVRFMKMASPEVYTWPSADDVSWIPHSDIIQKLTPPALLAGRGIKLKFISAELKQCQTEL